MLIFLFLRFFVFVGGLSLKMEDKKENKISKNEFVCYYVDVQAKNKKNNKKEVEPKQEEHKNVNDSLNKLIYDIFHGDGSYAEKNKYYTINSLQMNLIINEVEWYKDFAECIKKEKTELQSREVLLLYQVFVTRILYMILMNHGDNLQDYVKTNDLKSKFDVLCDEFIKAIPDFKTNDDALNFLFGKMFDIYKNKNDTDKMKQEILSCVKSLSTDKNSDGGLNCDFEIDDGRKIGKINSCCITGDENDNDEDDEIEFKMEIRSTTWQKNPGKEIFLKQTDEIKTQNNIDYNKLKPIDGLLENNQNHLVAIRGVRWGEEKTVENKTPISYKMLLPYLDKKNENADRNFEAILSYYDSNKWESKYLKPIIQVGIYSFKEIFMPNSVLKEYWTQKKFLESTKDNFDDLLDTLKELDFNINYQDFGIFKYKDEDGNFYTHRLVLENLGDFCYVERIVDDCAYDDEYTKITNKIKVKLKYENDFKSIKIKPNTFDRQTLIDQLKKNFIRSWNENGYQKDILHEKYHQCLKLIPIAQLLKTKIYDNTSKEYLCDFDMLNDLDDKCENIEQMVKQIIKEAMKKNDTIKMDGNNKLDSWNFNRLDAKEKDDYIEKSYNYYNIFEGNNLSEIISKKLKDGTIKIRSDNHEVIKAIFKTFKYKFDGLKATDNKENYFSQCCNLVKELCAKYEDEKEFVTYELFGTMLDHITDCFSWDTENYAKILFQLDDSSDNKNYKFTTDQQIGFLKLLIDKLNNENEKDKDNIKIQYVFGIMIQQNTQVPLDQEVIDFLFLNINNPKYLGSWLWDITFYKYKFSLSLNVVERMFDLFINDKNLQDNTKQNYLFKLISHIILNDNINFISDDKKQIDEIKDLKEEQRQIRLNFIKMYLEKIKGNKKLISSGILNHIFKYFDNSLDIKKEIANYIK